jgi:hypothetical protein
MPVNAPFGIARFLGTMRRASAEQQAADLATRAATHAPLDNPAAVAELLTALRDAGAEQQAADLIARDPATIDGLVWASSMAVLCAARHRVPVPSLARWLLALGIAATLTANMAQGWSHGPVGAVVAACPAVSLVGSYELVVWLIRTSGPTARAPSAEHPGNGAACCTAARPVAASVADGKHPAGSKRGTAGPAVAAYRLSVQTGNPLSERRLAQIFGRTSRRWARARIADARQASPLLGSPSPAQQAGNQHDAVADKVAQRHGPG